MLTKIKKEYILDETILVLMTCYVIVSKGKPEFYFGGKNMRILHDGSIKCMPCERRNIDILKYYLKHFYKARLVQLEEILQNLGIDSSNADMECIYDYNYMILKVDTGEEVRFYIGDGVEMNPHIKYNGIDYGVEVEKGRIYDVYVKSLFE